MNAYVVDTNVPVVANGKSAHADEDCVEATLSALENVRSAGLIVLDADMEIISEYMKHLSMSGQPGAGDFFMKWVWSVQADARYCEQVQLKKTKSGDYADFPRGGDLTSFDRSDRKFVVVAMKSINRPVVLNAVDSDWSECRMALKNRGIRIQFLCPQHCG